MGNMFDPNDPDNVEVKDRQPVPLQRGRTRQVEVASATELKRDQGGGEERKREPDPPAAVDTKSPFGNKRFGGKTFGGQTHGGQTFGGWQPGDNRDPGETGGFPDVPAQDNRSWGERNSLGAKPGGARPGGNTYGASSRNQGPDAPGPGVEPPPPVPPSDTRSWGERNSLGAKPGGNTFGGQTFGGWRPGDNRDPGETGGQPDVERQDKRSWGERHSLGAKPGGNTFGGNTFGGNKFGRSAGEEGADDPMKPAYVPGEEGADDPMKPAYVPGQATENRDWAGAGEQPPRDQETGGTPDAGKPTPYPILRPKAQPPGGGKGGGGSGGGTGGKTGGGGAAGGGKRLGLGDQRRTEAYDPTLDRADPRNVAPVDEKYRVNPKLWEDAQKGAIDPTKPGVRTGETAQRYTNNYTNALEGATNYMAEMFHQKKGDPNQGEGYAAMTFKGVGAPDPNIVAGVFNVVDPKNEMQPKERMELATRAMHDWYVSKGDKKSADKVAAEMLQYGNKQAQALGKQALENIKGGNRDAAVAAIKQAYDWLPDGYHADVAGNKLTITNDKNQVVNSFPLDDKQIANLGTGLATGTLFWDVVQDRAGKPGTFAPPTAQPQQAIAPTAPSGPPGGSPPATAQAPPPSPQAPPQGPAAAGPPPSATPSAPPGVPPGPPRPPGPAAPPPPSGAAPAPASGPPSGPPPVPVTPPGNRPVAPAPAAPGPAPTQAPVRMPGPGPAPVAAGTGIKAPEMEVVNPQPPPTLQPQPAPAPTQQQAAAPAGQQPPAPPQGSGGPPGSPAGQPPQQGAPPAGQPAQTGQPKQGDLVWSNDDPDSVPTVGGKPRIERRATYPMSDEVKVARQEQATVEAKYKADQDWLATKQKTLKGTTDYQKIVNQLRSDIEKTYKIATDKNKETISDWKKESAAHDAQERTDLKPRHLEGTARERADKIATDHFAKIVEEKGDVFKNSALRLYSDSAKQAPLVDAVSMIKAINPMVSEKKIAEMVVTAVTHVGSGDAGKKDSLNGHGGEKGSRFLVVGEDLARNPVIVLGDGNSRIKLHVPRDTLNDLKRLKTESYKDVAKKLTDEKNKPKTDYSTWVPEGVKAIAKYRGDQITAATKDAPQRKEEATVKPSAAAPPSSDAGAPAREMTPSQQIEADRQRNRTTPSVDNTPPPKNMTGAEHIEWKRKRREAAEQGR